MTALCAFDAVNKIAMPALTSGFLDGRAEPTSATGAGNNQVNTTLTHRSRFDGATVRQVIVSALNLPTTSSSQRRPFYGAGLAVTYTTSKFSRWTPGGDDTFDVLLDLAPALRRALSLSPAAIDELAGDVAGDVVSRDIEGTSGASNHDVRSGDPLYDGIVANGLDLIVARPTQGQ